MPVVPGAVTPGEIMAILATGIDLIKFFPASVDGGLKAIKALSAPFPQVRFIPTGGINADNMTEWLSNPAIAAIGGSWMVPAKAIDAGDFDTVRDLCAAAAATAAELDKKA
ncbi:aldolase [Acidipropionibacterium acidipropionici]|nr:aldolase [Acidipropionibacterium acidipropionici]